MPSRSVSFMAGFARGPADLEAIGQAVAVVVLLAIGLAVTVGVLFLLE